MKFLGKVFLVTIFVFLFLPFLFATSAKFQFLSPDYWIGALRVGDTYPKLEKILVKLIEAQAKAEGTSLKETGMLTGILTSGNLQDFAEKNIKLTLEFANGKTNELKFYIPTQVIPKGLLPSDLMKSNEISPEKLSALFGPQIAQDQSQYQSLAKAGANTTASWITSLILLLAILFLGYLITDPGKKLLTPSFSLIISSLLALFIVFSVSLWGRSAALEMVKNETEPAAQLAGVLAPVLTAPVTALWRKIALGILILGIALLFVKKPSLKKTKKKQSAS